MLFLMVNRLTEVYSSSLVSKKKTTKQSSNRFDIRNINANTDWEAAHGPSWSTSQTVNQMYSCRHKLKEMWDRLFRKIASSPKIETQTFICCFRMSAVCFSSFNLCSSFFRIFSNAFTLASSYSFANWASCFFSSKMA